MPPILVHTQHQRSPTLQAIVHQTFKHWECQSMVKIYTSIGLLRGDRSVFTACITGQGPNDRMECTCQRQMLANCLWATRDVILSNTDARTESRVVTVLYLHRSFFEFHVPLHDQSVDHPGVLEVLIVSEVACDRRSCLWTCKRQADMTTGGCCMIALCSQDRQSCN